VEELNSLADLLDLQAVDSEIDRLLHDRNSLPALKAYRRAHSRATAVTASRDQMAVDLKQAELDLDKTSGELGLAEIKLAAEQNRLYAGGISARDADYLRREVEMLDRKKREMEDEVLALMERREELQTGLAELETSVAAADEEKASHEAEITEAWKGIDAELARKERRKSDIVPAIPEDLLELYERLRLQKEDGVAVGRLADDTCGACHLRLTRAEQLEVKRTDPPRCLHCQAILVP
jgi:predicted  nucleic acid-binding Zn-ribbon protein